jgi:hypothetical protein
MMQVNMVSQGVALRVAVLENTAFPAHGSLREICKERANYIGYSCKSNTDLSQRRPHEYWAFEIFQRRLIKCAAVFPNNAAFIFTVVRLALREATKSMLPKVALVESFKKGDALLLSGAASATTHTPSNDVCLVKLNVGPGNLEPVDAPPRTLPPSRLSCSCLTA